MAVFDFAVNSGVSRSAKYLQRIVGVAQDGVIGNGTLAAVGRHDPAKLVRRLCGDRLAFLKRLRHWKTFGRGWSRRVGEVLDVGLMMARNANTEEVTHEPKEGGRGEGPKSLIGLIVDLIAKLFGGGDR